MSSSSVVPPGAKRSAAMPALAQLIERVTLDPPQRGAAERQRAAGDRAPHAVGLRRGAEDPRDEAARARDLACGVAQQRGECLHLQQIPARIGSAVEIGGGPSRQGRDRLGLIGADRQCEEAEHVWASRRQDNRDAPEHVVGREPDRRRRRCRQGGRRHGEIGLRAEAGGRGGRLRGRLRRSKTKVFRIRKHQQSRTRHLQGNLNAARRQGGGNRGTPRHVGIERGGGIHRDPHHPGTQPARVEIVAHGARQPSVIAREHCGERGGAGEGERQAGESGVAKRRHKPQLRRLAVRNGGGRKCRVVGCRADEHSFQLRRRRNSVLLRQAHAMIGGNEHWLD